MCETQALKAANNLKLGGGDGDVPFGNGRTTVLLKVLLGHMWVGIDFNDQLYEGLRILLDGLVKNWSINL